MEQSANLHILYFIISFIQGCFGFTPYGNSDNTNWIGIGFIGFCGALIVILLTIYALVFCFCREKLHFRRYWGIRNINRVRVTTMPPTTTTTVQVTTHPPVKLPPAYPPAHLPAHPPVHPPPYSYTDPLQPTGSQQPAYPQQPVYSQQPAYPQQPTYSHQPAYPQQPTCPPQPAYSQQPTCPQAQEPAYPKKNLKFVD